MRKLWTKIDWIMVPRLMLSSIMFIEGYKTNDNVAIGFGLFLAVYAFFGAKYKVGCGYNACGYVPSQTESKSSKIGYTEIK